MRNHAIDQLRGLAIFLMILVNFPGSWGAIYTPLTHAEIGIRIADLVFPIFLWTVGYSIQLSLQRRRTQSNLDFCQHAFLRFLALCICGFLLSLFPNANWEDFRIPGVLQRIAFCYLIVILLFRFFTFKTALFVTISLSLAAALLNRFFIYGEFGLMLSTEPPTIESSLGANFDRYIFGKHLWKESKLYDPEGILTSVCSLLTVILGLLTYQWESKTKKRNLGFLIGFCYLTFGFLLTFVFPISKNNWSLSFLFITASLIQFIYLFFCLAATKEKLSHLTRIFGFLFGESGKHALIIFFISGLIARTKSFGLVRTFTFQNILIVTQDKRLASFLFSLLVYFLILILTFLVKRTILQSISRSRASL